MAPSLSDC